MRRDIDSGARDFSTFRSDFVNAWRDNLQEFQVSSARVERIVVIPAEGDRINLPQPTGEALVKAIETGF